MCESTRSEKPVSVGTPTRKRGGAAPDTISAWRRAYAFAQGALQAGGASEPSTENRTSRSWGESEQRATTASDFGCTEQAWGSIGCGSNQGGGPRHALTFDGHGSPAGGSRLQLRCPRHALSAVLTKVLSLHVTLRRKGTGHGSDGDPSHATGVLRLGQVP